MSEKHVVMIAAENGALPDGCVTSVGAMTRALPPALAAHGWRTTVLTPAYGVHHRQAGAQEAGAVQVRFAGATHSVALYRIVTDGAPVEHLVLDHPRFSPQGAGLIYSRDAPDAPFATDATKFAFFCAAAAVAIARLPAPPDVVHVHDWHAALYFALRAFDPDCLALRPIRTVFTLHSLAVQGRRPLSFTASSLRSWYPTLSVPRAAVVDPVYDDCANPVATALRLADAVSVGSPTFAREIQRVSHPERGQCGGFGLHALLREASRQGRLLGVLDGCTYPAAAPRKPTWRSVRDALRAANTRWLAQSTHVRSAHYIADKNLAALPDTRPALLLTSCGALGDNEFDLYRRSGAGGASVLETLVAGLRGSERLLLLGAGDPAHEQFAVEIAARHPRLIYLCGPVDDLAPPVLALGDLHLLPHASAPGPGPALRALRAGQPCVAHAVGGLADVLRDGANGWLFQGRSRAAQARNFLQATNTAVAARRAGGKAFGRYRRAATTTRHDWSATADALLAHLYTGQ